MFSILLAWDRMPGRHRALSIPICVWKVALLTGRQD